MAKGDVIIEIRGLHFRRGDMRIFDDIDMDIREGEVTAIMGPSGTGKTTLLRLITGQLQADKGSIKVFGQEISRLSRNELYALRKRMGFLFQAGALLTDMDVYENVSFPLHEHTQLPESMIRDLVKMKLEAVGLRGALEMMPSELSGGMARRVALARAIIMDPEIIFYDEPFVGLDPISMGVIVRLIRELNDALGLTSVVVSHDIKEISSVSDKVFLLSNARVVASGSPQELAESRSDWVRQFMHGEADGPVPFHFPASSLEQDFMGGAE